MKKSIIFNLIIISVLSLYKCNDIERPTLSNKHLTKSQKSWIGKHIGRYSYGISFKNSFGNDYTYITYINGNCGTCVSKLSIWKEYIESIEDKNNNVFHFILGTRDSIVLKYLLEENGLKFEYIKYVESWDIVEDIPFLNNSSDSQTVLVDSLGFIAGIISYSDLLSSY